MTEHNKGMEEEPHISEIRKIRKSVFFKLIGLVSLIIIGLGVKWYMDEKQFQDEMTKVVEENKFLVDEWLKQNDSLCKIKTVEIDYSTVKHNPMGGIMVQGYVNNDEELAFSVGFRKYVQAETEEYSDVELIPVRISADLDDYLGESGVYDE
ncbi:DUF1310 family protein [Enterococcus sp. LJL51]|uniref:DUF1310 family protein n=1 Tax=Enterococcus sp. LJL51 TaxID=3416656 RepID=UPI003CF7AEE1